MEKGKLLLTCSSCYPDFASCAGLSVESSQEQALQAELSLVQAEEAALPLKIIKLQEALHLEEAELQRRESGIQKQPNRPAVPTRHT